MTGAVQTAILALPEQAWTPAVEADGNVRDGADVAELTGMLPDLAAAGWPAGMRVLVRRERPHPGAQLSFTDHDGWRFQAFATDTPNGRLAHLEARHRAHARVEDRIRCAKATGLNHLPFRQQAINTVWVELVGVACDLLAWTRLLLLDGQLARAEPKTLRYRILHVAARLVRGGRRLKLRIDSRWPWQHDIVTAFATVTRTATIRKLSDAHPAHPNKDTETPTPRRASRHAHLTHTAEQPRRPRGRSSTRCY